MPLMVYGELLPDHSIKNIGFTETLREVAANEVAIYFGASVSPHRQVEIMGAWAMLWNGIRDRNLLDNQFFGAVVYSGVSIDSITEANRRTESSVASFNADDVMIGIDDTVTAALRGATVMYESAFESLRDNALQLYLKAA